MDRIARRQIRPARAGVLAAAAAALVMLGAMWPAVSAWADVESGQRAYDAGDFDAAHSDWLAAALDGDPEAQFRLGLMLANGSGVPRDVVSAYAWLMLAGKGGIDGAKEKSDILLKEYLPRHCHFDALALVRSYESGRPERLAAGGRQKSRCWNFEQY